MSKTNDPRESKQWSFDFLMGRFELTGSDHERLRNWFSEALKAQVKLVCFCRDKEPLTGDHTQDTLRRGFARSRMWAQYADSHRGVCLVFDKAKLIESVGAAFPNHRCLHGDVTYRDHYIVRSARPNEYVIDVDRMKDLGPDAYVAFHFDKYHNEMFFEKLLDWRDEQEWRLIVLSKELDGLYLPIEESLVGVMHGALIQRRLSERIMNLTESKPIEHMGLIWKNSNPWYDLGAGRWSKSDGSLIGEYGRRSCGCVLRTAPPGRLRNEHTSLA